MGLFPILVFLVVWLCVVFFPKLVTFWGERLHYGYFYPGLVAFWGLQFGAVFVALWLLWRSPIWGVHIGDFYPIL